MVGGESGGDGREEKGKARARDGTCTNHQVPISTRIGCTTTVFEGLGPNRKQPRSKL